MKIYFGASLLFSKERKSIYEQIVRVIEKGGNQVLGFDILARSAKEVIEMSDETRVESYKKFLNWIGKCDQAVFEASFPSTLHIGHEISMALEKGKPVTVLYQKGFKPFFFAGVDSEKLTLIEYIDDGDMMEKLERKLVENMGVVDTRFNFFISPEIGRYLDWIHREKKTPRAVFLRSLLEKAMKTDKDYEK